MHDCAKHYLLAQTGAPGTLVSELESGGKPVHDYHVGGNLTVEVRADQRRYFISMITMIAPRYGCSRH